MVVVGRESRVVGLWAAEEREVSEPTVENVEVRGEPLLYLVLQRVGQGMEMMSSSSSVAISTTGAFLGSR